MGLRRRAATAAVLMTVASSVVGCSFVGGEPHRIFEYRLVDEHTIDVRSDTGTGWKTWVESVSETDASVTIDVRMTRTDPFAGGPSAAETIWLTVKLAAPLGDRDIVDASTNTSVKRLDEGTGHVTFAHAD